MTKERLRRAERRANVVAMESSQPDRFDSLMVAVDFAPAADRMLPIVGRFAQKGGLSIELVTTGSKGLEEYDFADLSERTRAVHGCPVSTKVLEGTQTAADLAGYARSRPGALLCLASHGRTALGDLIVGSMTEELLRQHAGPMFAVGPDVPDDNEPSDHLLVSVDADALHTPLLAVSAAWQATFGGTVELFEAVTKGSAAVEVAPTEELIAAQALLPTAKTTVVESHDPARAIGDQAMSSGSIIAVAAHARGGLERLVRGSVTGELLHRATVPLLIVPA